MGTRTSVWAEVVAARYKGVLGARCGHRQWGRWNDLSGASVEGMCPIQIPGLLGCPFTYLNLPEHHLLIPAT